MNKFKEGEFVIYQNGERFELGEIKAVVNFNGKWCYRVWYHMGETTALTDEYLLHKIENGYAFKIVREKV